MGLKFKSPLELSGHRAIAHTDVAQTLVVKVVTKTTAHPEYGNGSTSGYTIDGVEGAYLEFTPGNTYKFDQADSSNANHPLRFYEDAAKATAYTTGVTTSGTPGSSGAYTQIIPTTNTPPVLFYQCSAHSLMGSYVKFGTGTIGDTYSINATQDGSNVDLNLDAASGTDSTVQLTAGSNVTLTRNDAQQVTIAASGGGITVQEEGSSLSTAATTLNFTGAAVTASGSGATKTIDVTGGAITVQEEGSSLSTAATTLNFTGSAVTASGSGAVKTINVTGGGSGTVTIEKNVYTGDGSDVTFDTSTAIVNENNVQVYIDGVYQSKDNYTTSGSTVTMSTAPGNSTSVELIHMVSTSGVIARDSFTGNGSTTAYVLTMSISNENATQVYLDGVYQSKNNYSTSGSTLTFSTAPSNGTAIEVVHIKAVSASSLNQNNFTGNGSTTAFTLSQTIDDEAKTFVFIQGVYQEKSTYSISGTTLTFATAPQNGYTVEVIAFNSITISNLSDVTSVNGLTGAVTLETGTDWQSTVQTSNFTAAAGKGYFVDTSSNTVTVSLPAGGVGDEIHFVDYASTFDTNEILFAANGSEKIQGRSTNAKNTTENAVVRLIYQNATKGWTADNLTDDPPLVTTDFLVIAGGGGAGRSDQYYGGGGGAGGFRSSADGNGGGQSSDAAITAVPATNYTVTIGAGGTAPSHAGASGGNGTNSVFSTITSVGGGGGRHFDGNGLDGGCGGGAGGNYNAGTGGAAVTSPVVHGYAGGNMPFTGQYSRSGAGGGGAGSVGANSGSVSGGAGGDAKASSITGSAVYYSGGGGGKKGISTNGAPGANSRRVANSGDAGGTNGTASGAGYINTGFSGVVILKYPNTNTITVGAGLTSSTATVGSYKVTTFTAGTGNINF
jgi:hypothetical protein